MNDAEHVTTGGDPRALPDYAALRDEMLKLTHPARPDVDWDYAEALCLKLFKQNGIELMTAAWYTLVRMQTVGLAGMNEGLALINALTTRHWMAAWPTSLAARMEIITVMTQRLLNTFRAQNLNEDVSLPMILQAEKHLALLRQTLDRHELKQARSLEGLQQQLRQAAIRLEKMPGCQPPEPVEAPPSWTAVTAAAEESSAGAGALIYVVQAEPERKGAVMPLPKKGRYIWSFISGVCAGLLVCGVLFWGWRSLQTLSQTEQQLMASLQPLPAVLSPEQLTALRQTPLVTAPQAAGLVEQTRQQLNWLQTLPPGWSLHYGQALTDQARALWPDNPAVMEMQQEWQRKMEATALPLTALDGWHQGMTKLQLNALDEKRGKYLTVSELKSAVFGLSQAFSRTVPAEEQLRLLTEASPGSATSVAQQSSAEQSLAQLISRYALTAGPAEKQ